MSPKDHISNAEIGRDALQDTVEATVTAVGAVVMTITTAVRDIARTVGGLATEVFDIRVSRAAADTRRPLGRLLAANRKTPHDHDLRLAPAWRLAS